MSNIFHVVLTTPHEDYSPTRAVDAGLEALGFEAAHTEDSVSREVWLLLGRKLNYYDAQKFGIDGLRDQVLALPWHDWHVDTHLQVLWSDDWTTADDDFSGRVNPFTWNQETWVVPSVLAARRRS